MTPFVRLGWRRSSGWDDGDCQSGMTANVMPGCRRLSCRRLPPWSIPARTGSMSRD